MGFAVPKTPEKHVCASQVALAWRRAVKLRPREALAAGGVAFC